MTFKSYPEKKAARSLNTAEPLPKPTDSKAIKHEGFHLQRLSPKADNPREIAFAEQWKQENENNLLLHLLLGPEENPLSPFGGKRDRFAELTQENASVAATVAQWLGSNIGMSFLEEALKRCGYKIVRDEPKSASPPICKNCGKPYGPDTHRCEVPA